MHLNGLLEKMIGSLLVQIHKCKQISKTAFYTTKEMEVRFYLHKYHS